MDSTATSILDAESVVSIHRRISASGPPPHPTAANVLSHGALPTDPGEPDTCRICRGEATPDEPLFYPCKCSGSIKYVHQDCLMEWLSHSQKKHCELCKTPFRFTKLYSPTMPKSLPFYVFVSHIAKYIFRNVLVWARAFLVLTVWLCWLPYLMRSVWSFLFWISDEGLGAGTAIFSRQNEGLGTRGDLVSLSLMNPTACPSSPLFAATTTPASVGSAIDRLPERLKGFYDLAVGLGYPVPAAISRLFASGVAQSSKPSFSNISRATFLDSDVSSSTSVYPPTLLSDVAILRNVTSSPTVNRTLIAILEGQIITVLVIICFILVILVRDYVVQQQPEINMRAAFAAAGNVEPLQPPDNPPGGLRAEDIDNLRGPDESEDDQDTPSHRNGDVADNAPQQTGLQGLDHNAGFNAWEDGDRPLQGPRPRPIAGLHRRVPRHRRDPGDVVPAPEVDTNQAVGEDRNRLFVPVERNTSPAATNNGVEGATDSTVQPESSTVHEYLRIWREAGGDREKVLRIVREENLEDKMDYWIKLTKSMIDRGKPGAQDEAGESSNSVPSRSPHPSPGINRPSRGSEDSSEWSWPDNMNETGSSNSSGKGKAKASADFDADTPATLDAKSLRSTQNADQSYKSNNAMPLGNSNWSFSNLPKGSTSQPVHVDPHIAVNIPPSPTANDTAQAWSFASPPKNESARHDSPTSSTFAGSSSEMEVEDASVHFDAANHSAPTSQDGRDWAELPDFNDLQGARQTPPDAEPARHQPEGLADLVAEFMFRGLDTIAPQELPPHPLEDNFAVVELPLDDDEAPMDEILRQRDAAEAAAAENLDAEALEDAEDFEGVMELIGMRGPVAGLFQNAIFCAFLVSITIFLGVFVPYNIGRIAIWTVANPWRPARILFSVSKFVQDVALMVIGTVSWLVFVAIDLLRNLLQMKSTGKFIADTAATSWDMSANAAIRVVNGFVIDLPPISAGEIRNFSALSHEALLTIKSFVVSTLNACGQTVLFVVGGDYSSKTVALSSMLAKAIQLSRDGLRDLSVLISNPGSWVIDLSSSDVPTAVNPELAVWSAMDRFWAILGGYTSLSLLAGLYLRRGSPFSSSQTGQDWEASIIDGLNQASGVMKVILIIGIEMLVFPLYCGLLLDVALLPLFENTTIVSRLLFTVNYPLTSIFVHWFVGTGYMFHFALFVSMCRKIMRKGVLYFIRDPDDPEFHPVRDVLERNVMTQLRKILFSAFVYGALVIICLGGVVWGLAFAMPHVLPIHYSSNEPVLEFPIDLLFYNFLMPLAIKFFKPSDGLHIMYTWWFRKCARALRITWFLFGERKVDEEGTLVLAPESPYLSLPWWKRQLLEYSDSGEVIPKTWKDTFDTEEAMPTPIIASDDMIHLNMRKIMLVRTKQLVPDGRFVRTPASDQVKIPKGKRVFLDVSETNLRLDGRPDVVETDLYSTNQYQFVYIPPHFRVRVFLFIMFIWMFAAVTGVGITIVPLMFGRHVFQLLIPSHIRTNDIYAFSIGIYILGSVAYTIFHIRSMYDWLTEWTRDKLSSVAGRDAVRRVVAVAAQATKLIYAYAFLLLVFPLLVSSIMELYFLIPLDTYMYSNLIPAALPHKRQVAGAQNPRHAIRVIQSWTIGLLYLKLGARIITTWYRDSRLASAVRAVLRNGWLEPDIAILTRAFIVPGLALWISAIVGPLVSARIFIKYGITGAGPNDAALVLIYRLSFPIAAISALAACMLWGLVGVFKSWKVRIRDEAYLIGERLHNFGVVAGPARARGAWRATGTRL